MKTLKLGFLLMCFSWLVSCSSSDDNTPTAEQTITFNFTHNWDGSSITNTNFNNIQYTNANGDLLSIEKLRYLISNITFQNTNGATFVVHDYNLVDVTNNTDMSYVPEMQIPTGTYNVSFTYGFNNQDNIDGAYPDLNTALWNVPLMLGGGYHFMQLEGKFIDNTDVEIGYQYHAIRAVNNTDPNNLQFQDTFIDVNLGTISIENSTSIEVKMNIAEWFKNPIQWDLNSLNSMLMPNYGAQIIMYNNGQNVFSLGSVTQ